MRLVSANIRRPLKLLGMALVAPLAVAIVSREWTQAIVFAGLAGATYLMGRREPSSTAPIAPRDALVFAAIVYLVFSLVGALAYLPHASLVDGFFESMSGFTTTGLSVLDPGSMPNSLLFFRSYSQWIGGAGIIVLSIVFLPGVRATLLPLYSAEFREENLLGNLLSTSRLVFSIYGGLTLLGLGVFVLSGMGFFDALLHVLSTLSTGGFSPYPDSIGRYGSVGIEIWVCLFMIAGAVAFPLYYRAAREGPKKFFADSQLRALALAIGAGFVLTLLYDRSPGGHGSIVTHVFHSVSAVTTTGFNVTDAGGWTQGQRLVAIVLMFIGGSSGSTAGGVKLIRALVLARVAQWYLHRALLPAEAQLPVRQGGRILRDDEIRSVVGLTMVFLWLIALSTFLLTLTGCEPIDALFESTSALGTVGLSTGLTSSDLESWAKLLLAMDMWAGRLEILPLLVLLYPSPRRSGRSS
ncbi:MAG TPA: TrkH family potassium uptake protein [Vicinamibacteria bacterium]|nr:TrkH family potassium uptake protein [Vicinamibacteria bacterium]